MAVPEKLYWLIMNSMERIKITNTLPSGFYEISRLVYENLPFKPEEDQEALPSLLRQKCPDHEVILYTDHREIRLMGIFPAQENVTYFGYWESTDNPELNRQAFSLLETDAKKRGKNHIMGPLHFNTFHRYRLRLDEPSWNKFDREPVNPSWYPSLLEKLGYSTLYSFESRLILKSDIPDLYLDKQDFLATLKNLPFSFIPLTPENWKLYEKEIFELVHTIFSRNPAYRPVSEKEFRLLYNSRFAEKLCPWSSVLFRDNKTGILVAMSFCHPNYQADGGPENQAPNFKRDFEKLKHRVLLAKTVGVHPDYRQKNMMSYLAAYAMQTFRECYDEVLFCLMRSDNFSLNFTDGLPFESARYALYQKKI